MMHGQIGTGKLQANTTLAQHYSDIGSTPRVPCVIIFSREYACQNFNWSTWGIIIKNTSPTYDDI